jgi:diguanylate cyclase
MIEYAESKVQAQAAARNAVQSMEKFGVIPNPNSFAVWYIHHSNRLPDLSREIERLIKLGSDFGPAIIQALHDKYVTQANESKTLAAAGMRIENTLEQLLKMFQIANRGTESYGATLAGLSDQVEGANGESLHEIMASVVSETQKMLRVNRKLGTELTQSSQQIARLREDLEQVRTEASTDGLTGVANRKVFDNVMGQAARHAADTGSHLSLLMMDIDLFKQFNDNHGHQMGDQVLKLVARTIQSCVRPEDTVARYGGEEFAAILPSASRREAADVAERIRTTVASKRITNRRSGMELGRITLSIGISEYAIGESVGEMVQRADQALYLAKRMGPNQVMTQSELEKSGLL